MQNYLHKVYASYEMEIFLSMVQIAGTYTYTIVAKY